ncbi:SDR family NAD(P)-dependent oxidoreductase [Baekduia soli]|uniref:SDR family NAD(P)-dependent oxidoreductase n=1 Tax=Baekduia soli TaxID=496014 RepID=UPI001651F371|nr:SDR family NAD(P)-dependent oxidoreductase [Baekduia soli]
MTAQGRRVAVVTGAGQGIGRGIAATLVARGLRVAVVDRHPDRAQATAAALGPAAVPVAADLLDEHAVAAMAATVLEALGRWDVLVNNAGALRLGSIGATTVADWDAVFDGCVKTAWLCTRAAAGPLAASGEGRIINVSSVVARGAASENLIAYTAAKGAVEALTVACARELGASGITVNAVCPGSIETPAWDRFPDPDGLRRARAAVAAVGRIGRPEEIGAAVAYLASPEAGFVTGQVLVVDGGRTDKL